MKLRVRQERFYLKRTDSLKRDVSCIEKRALWLPKKFESIWSSRSDGDMVHSTHIHTNTQTDKRNIDKTHFTPKARGK